MRVTMYDSTFSVTLTETRLALVIEALIDKAQETMEDIPCISKERLEFAKELHDNYMAELEAHKRSFLGTQIQTRLDALED